MGRADHLDALHHLPEAALEVAVDHAFDPGPRQRSSGNAPSTNRALDSSPRAEAWRSTVWMPWDWNQTLS
jgi:hypothetical protein